MICVWRDSNVSAVWSVGITLRTCKMGKGRERKSRGGSNSSSSGQQQHKGGWVVVW